MNWLRRIAKWYLDSPPQVPRRPTNPVNEELMRRVREAEQHLPVRADRTDRFYVIAGHHESN